jgi:hypothetical protein
MKQPGTRDLITSFRQLEVAIRLCDDGPLRAKELRATGALLAHMEKRGMVKALPGGSYLNSVWTLTPMGKKETRRCRKVYNDWLKSNR